MERNIDKAMANIIASLKNATLYGLYDELGSMKTVVRGYIKSTVTECARQQQKYEIQQNVYAPLGGISDEDKEPKKNIDVAMANVIEVLNNPELYDISPYEVTSIASIVKGYIESIVQECAKQQQSEGISETVIGQFSGDTTQKTTSLL